MELREGTFALFLSGQYNTATRKAYKGTVKSGSCASYVSFHNMTHFGMNDFVGPSEETHQVHPPPALCGAYMKRPKHAAGTVIFSKDQQLLCTSVKPSRSTVTGLHCIARHKELALDIFAIMICRQTGCFKDRLFSSKDLLLL